MSVKPSLSTFSKDRLYLGSTDRPYWPLSICWVSLKEITHSFLLDTDNQVIYKLDSNGKPTLFAGTPRDATQKDTVKWQNRFKTPSAFVSAVEDAEKGHYMLYVVDEEDNCIKVVNDAGAIDLFVGSQKAGYRDGTLEQEPLFSMPSGIAIDSNNKFMYVTPFLIPFLFVLSFSCFFLFVCWFTKLATMIL